MSPEGGDAEVTDSEDEDRSDDDLERFNREMQRQLQASDDMGKDSDDDSGKPVADQVGARQLSGGEQGAVGSRNQGDDGDLEGDEETEDTEDADDDAEEQEPEEGVEDTAETTQSTRGGQYAREEMHQDGGTEPEQLQSGSGVDDPGDGVENADEGDVEESSDAEEQRDGGDGDDRPDAEEQRDGGDGDDRPDAVEPPDVDDGEQRPEDGREVSESEEPEDADEGTDRPPEDDSTTEAADSDEPDDEDREGTGSAGDGETSGDRESGSDTRSDGDPVDEGPSEGRESAPTVAQRVKDGSLPGDEGESGDEEDGHQDPGDDDSDDGKLRVSEDYVPYSRDLEIIERCDCEDGVDETAEDVVHTIVVWGNHASVYHARDGNSVEFGQDEVGRINVDRGGSTGEGSGQGDQPHDETQDPGDQPHDETQEPGDQPPEEPTVTDDELPYVYIGERILGQHLRETGGDPYSDYTKFLDKTSKAMDIVGFASGPPGFSAGAALGPISSMISWHVAWMQGRELSNYNATLNEYADTIEEMSESVYNQYVNGKDLDSITVELDEIEKPENYSELPTAWKSAYEGRKTGQASAIELVSQLENNKENAGKAFLIGVYQKYGLDETGSGIAESIVNEAGGQRGGATGDTRFER